MNKPARILVCLVAALGVALIGPGTAVAQGGGGSAGNSQYVDPLSGNGSGHHHHSGSSTSTTTTTTSGSGSSGTLTTTPPGSVSGSSGASASSAASSPSKHDPRPRTLPFTGLNLWACALLGVMLLAAGAALRLTVPRDE